MTRPESLLLLFALVFPPLAFGAVEPWSRAIAESAALCGLLIALARRTRDGALRLHAAPGTLPLLLLLGWVLFQAVPLPTALLGAISPGSLSLWERTLGAAGPLPWVSISVDPAATLRELVRLAACAALYLLAVELMTRRERLRAFPAALATFAAALALVSVVQHLAAPLRLLFVRAAPFDSTPFGPFVNRNHFANLMAMYTPVIVGLAFGRDLPAVRGTLRERLSALLARPAANTRVLLGFAALLTAGALVVSLSRGAIVASCAGLLVYVGLLATRGIGRRRMVAALLLAAGIALFASWFGWERVTARFATIGEGGRVMDTYRAVAWQDTLRMAADFPLLGAGVGSFTRLYPVYQSIPGRVRVAHAHNDYLELLAGGGAVGLGLFVWFVGAVFTATLGATRRRRNAQALHLAFGALAGCVAFLAHGAVDFSLALDANALGFFFLLGLAVSASATRQREQDGDTLLPRLRVPAAVTIAAGTLGAAAVLWLAADLSARHAWRLAAEQIRRLEALEVTPAGPRRLIARAAALQPLDPAYPAALARIAARAGDAASARGLIVRAMRLAPTDPDLLQQLAAELSAGGEERGAGNAFDAAVAFDPEGPLRREAYGSWLLSRRRTGPALEQLRRAMELDAGRVPAVVALLVIAGFDDARIATVVPSRVPALTAFAKYLSVTGDDALAAETWRRVLAVDPGNAEAAKRLSRGAR